ncbi:MAG: histidine phosphatase family protein [Leptolyngbya sp. SIO1D8]|nr:histidine phosphatase family protein [Leptolyngbya sp. SIO1D8]
MSLNLYFLRHGETTHSQTGGYCGFLDPELTPSGLEMAQAFADAYQGLTWAAVFASPMKRTIATAKPLCEATGAELELREGLKELYYGKWEDHSSDDVQATYPDDYVQWLAEPAWNPPTGGETAVQVASRASAVIAEIEDAFTEGNVLVVSHKATIRIMLCTLLGIDLGRYRDRIEMPVASVSLVKFGRYGPLLKRLGDRAHLPDHLRNRAGT